MKVLITGSRGYIGSVLAKTLTYKGDNLVFGIDINPNIDGSSIYGLFTEENINAESIADAVVSQGIDTIFHLAAYADVGDSVKNPSIYYLNNVGNTSSLLHNLVSRGWKGKVVFSSTAAVYSDKMTDAIAEHHIIKPPNPYGRSKLACEQLLSDVCKSHGISVCTFRYFNVAGAWDDVGDHQHAGHIISKLCHSVSTGTQFVLNGDKRNTPDGTCIRDYLHVRDVCDAHIRAAEFLDSSPVDTYTFNLGTGRGWSNLEIIKAFERFTGWKVDYTVGPDRPGDPNSLVAYNQKFPAFTGYRYTHSSLENIIASSWKYYSNKKWSDDGISGK